MGICVLGMNMSDRQGPFAMATAQCGSSWLDLRNEIASSNPNGVEKVDVIVLHTWIYLVLVELFFALSCHPCAPWNFCSALHSLRDTEVWSLPSRVPGRESPQSLEYHQKMGALICGWNFGYL